MDLALQYNATLNGHDLTIDSLNGDFGREDTLATAVLLSLLCDRLAQADEVDAGADRRGWWADAYAAANSDASSPESFGSRLWLLMREKQVPQTQSRLRDYVAEALQWMIDDGMVDDVTVTVFVPRVGWYVAQVDLELDGSSRRFRFEWNGQLQLWRLTGELA